MGKKSSTPPPAPDARETAAAESQFNRLDTFSPSGAGVRHGYTDANGQFQSGVAPEGQQSAQKYIESDTERQIRTALEPASVDLTNRVIADSIVGMPDAARVRDRGDVAQDIFNRSFSLMAPGIDRANERLLTNLQARGMPVGSEGFNEAYGNQIRETQDTISRLAMDSNLAAGQEQSREFGLDAAARSGAIAELVAAMGGGYNPPNSTPSGQAAQINYGGLVNQQYQSELRNYEAQQQQKMASASAVGSLGSALIKSSMMVKDIQGMADPERAAWMIENLKFACWTYKEGEAPEGDHGGIHVGPMAEHFQQLTQIGRHDRIDVTDYLGVMGAALQSALQRIKELEHEVFMLDFDDDTPEVRVH